MTGKVWFTLRTRLWRCGIFFLSLFFFFFLLQTFTINVRTAGQYTTCWLQKKKCTTKFGWCRGSQGSSRGTSSLGRSEDKSQGPGSLGTPTKLTCSWEDRQKRDFFAFLLLYWGPGSRGSLWQSYSPGFGEPESHSVNNFLDPDNNNHVFSYSVSPFFQKKQTSKQIGKPAPKQKNHFVQTLVAGTVGPIFLLALPLRSIPCQEPGPGASFIWNKVITHHSGQMQHNWWCEWMEKISCQKKKVNHGHITPGSLIPG